MLRIRSTGRVMIEDACTLYIAAAYGVTLICLVALIVMTLKQWLALKKE